MPYQVLLLPEETPARTSSLDVVHITRIGLTPLKGTAHEPLEEVELTPEGPRGDRVFCLLDLDSGRVLRTVENDTLVGCRSRWEPPVLTVTVPARHDAPRQDAVPPRDVSGRVVDGRFLLADYWGRAARLFEVDGPWARVLSEYLGRDVAVCRVASPGDIVWAGPVSLVSTSSLAELARRTGQHRDDGARLRATFVVDTGDASPFVEDGWAGRRLQLGEAVLQVNGPLARCAVVDIRPGVGGRDDVGALKAMAIDRVRDGEVQLAVDADVVTPGTVRGGDPVTLLDP